MDPKINYEATKHNILDSSNQGKDIFDLELRQTLKLKKPIISPLREDTNPSFNIFKNGTDVILFKDHGTGLSGDCFKFIKEIHPSFSWEDTLKHCANLANAPIQYLKNDYSYWENYRISETECKQIGVEAKNEIFILHQNGYEKKYDPAGVKLPSKYINMTGKEKPALCTMAVEKHQNKFLVFVEGWKDTIVANAWAKRTISDFTFYGIDSSETLPEQLPLEEIKENFDYIFFMPDNDDSGRKAAERFSKHFKILYQDDVNDFADLVRKYNDQELKKKLLNWISELYDLNERAFLLASRITGIRTKFEPVINDLIIDRLPDFMKDFIGIYFGNPQGKEVATLSILLGFSACLPGLKVQYGTKSYECNLFGVLIAKPASNKAAMVDIIQMLWNIQKYWDLKTQEQEFKTRFMVSGDTTAAGLRDLLDRIYGRMIMIESEVKAMVKAFEGEHSYYDMLLRAAYNEPIMIDRKTIHVDLKNPAITALLTGTRDTLPKLTKGIEDGMLSRLIIYFVSEYDEWIDPRPNYESKTHELKDLIAEKLLKVYRVFHYNITERKEPTEVILSQEQWDKFNSFLKPLYNANKKERPGYTPTIKRMGLVIVKLISILTVAEKIDFYNPLDYSGGEDIITGYEPKPFYATDKAFNTAIMISAILFSHSLELFDDLDSMTVSNSKPMNTEYQKIYDAHKKEPSLSIRKLAEKLGITHSKVQRALDAFRKK